MNKLLIPLYLYAKLLAISMLFSIALTRFIATFFSLSMMAPRSGMMMRGLFMISFFMMFGGFFMMLSSFFVVASRFFVILCGCYSSLFLLSVN